MMENQQNGTHLKTITQQIGKFTKQIGKFTKQIGRFTKQIGNRIKDIFMIERKDDGTKENDGTNENNGTNENKDIINNRTNEKLNTFEENIKNTIDDNETIVSDFQETKSYYIYKVTSTYDIKYMIHSKDGEQKKIHAFILNEEKETKAYSLRNSSDVGTESITKPSEEIITRLGTQDFIKTVTNLYGFTGQMYRYNEGSNTFLSLFPNCTTFGGSLSLDTFAAMKDIAFPKLKTLSLYINDKEDKINLEKTPNIKELTLHDFDYKKTIVGIEEIENLTISCLKDQNIVQRVENNKDSLQNLKILSLIENHPIISESERKQIKKNLPKCKIIT